MGIIKASVLKNGKNCIEYKIEPGDSLTFIMKKLGYIDWRTKWKSVYYDEVNKEFRTKFTNYDIIKINGPNLFIPLPDKSYLLFDGKQLFWKTFTTDKTLFSVAAISGLKKNNPYIKTLIKQGRTDIEEGMDYTNPKYQNLSKAGPIKEGFYYLRLKKNIPFEKSGGGWGVGGWSIYPIDPLVKLLGTLEGKYDIDLPLIRSGFFLHHDGGADGTAGCIGIRHGTDINKIRRKLKEYQRAENVIYIRVKY